MAIPHPSPHRLPDPETAAGTPRRSRRAQSRSTSRRAAWAALLAMVVASATLTGAASHAQESSAWKPRWTPDGELLLPEDYHRWIFLGSPLTPNALNNGKAAFPEYHNVYVHPEVFAIYRRTGEWPEGTIMLKELQLVTPAVFPDGSSLEVSGRGYFPAERNGIDISVKDSSRFAETDGWGFFNFGHHAPPYLKTAAPQAASACATCHMANAEGMVFMKFYRPILDAQ